MQQLVTQVPLALMDSLMLFVPATLATQEMENSVLILMNAAEIPVIPMHAALIQRAHTLAAAIQGTQEMVFFAQILMSVNYQNHAV